MRWFLDDTEKTQNLFQRYYPIEKTEKRKLEPDFSEDWDFAFKWRDSVDHFGVVGVDDSIDLLSQIIPPLLLSPPRLPPEAPAK